MRYRDNLPLVLKNLSFTVREKEKVGIVGRTGSGKSSLMLAITRILNVVNSSEYPKLEYHQKIGEYKDIDKKKVCAPKKGKYGARGDFGTDVKSKASNGRFDFVDLSSQTKLIK